MSKPNLHYLGNDPDIIQEFGAVILNKKLSLHFSHSMNEPVTLAHENYSVIFVDFTCFPQHNRIIEQVIFLKKISEFQKILFVAIFANDEELNCYDYIFSSGFKLSFVKGGESYSLLRDSIYIALNELITYPNYAKATGLYKRMKTGLCSSITTINSSGFSLETNFKSRTGSLNISQKIFPELTVAEIIDDQLAVKNYPLKNAYQLMFPLTDPWNEEEHFSLLPETIDTWLELHQDEFKVKKDNLFVFDGSFNCLKEIFEVESSTELSTMYFQKIEEGLSQVELLRPSLIFIEADNDDAGPNSIGQIESLSIAIQMIKGYNPILIVTNMPSTTSAVCKLINYTFVICSNEQINPTLFSKFIELFIKKKIDNVSGDTFQISTVSKMRSIDINVDIIVRSITEHEIYFSSEDEFENFTVLHFPSPLEIFATIVPEYRSGSSMHDNRIKVALIHGISETKLEILRQLVNTLIVDPEADLDLSTENKLNKAV